MKPIFTSVLYKKQCFLLLVALVSFSFSFAGTHLPKKHSGEPTKPVPATMFSCPCSIFDTTVDKPSDGTIFNDADPIEVGVKFMSTVDGFINGIRFYKQPGTTGTHTGELYSYPGGVLLGSAIFTGETASGWQEVSFRGNGGSVPITAGDFYIAAVYSSSGDYAATVNYFATDTPNPPLIGLADGTDGTNGVYQYGPAPTFPTAPSGNMANYWVDAVFDLVALPVQLEKFSVVANGNNANLSWTTASEQNNKGFEIQRSTNGFSWNPIGFVNGAGTSQKALNYQYADKSLVAGKYYYRLNQIDFDGKSKISQAVSVAINAALTLDLQQNRPNPFNNSTTINLVIPHNGRVKLTLYDQQGRLVQEIINTIKQAGSYQLQVDRKGLGSGIYYYKLDAEGKTLVKKMTIL